MPNLPPEKNRRCAAFLWYFMLKKILAQRGYFFLGGSRICLLIFSSAGPHLSRSFSVCLHKVLDSSCFLLLHALTYVAGTTFLHHCGVCVCVRVSVRLDLFTRGVARGRVCGACGVILSFFPRLRRPHVLCGANTWHSKHLSSCSKK